MVSQFPHTRLPIALSLILLGAGTATAQSWTISSPACVMPSGTIEFTITADSGVVEQASGQWHMFWDPAVFQLDPTHGVGGIMFSSGWDGVANTMLPGDLFVASWHLLPYPTGVSTVATVRLTHIGGIGAQPITGTVEIWSDPSLSPIRGTPFNMVPASVAIGCSGLPSCTITSPAGGALLVAAGNIVFDASDPTSDPLDIFYEFDDGSGFLPATRVGGGPSMDLGVAPATGLTFSWDINADFLGPAVGVIFRITVVDPSMTGNQCTVVVDTDITNQTPTCSITSPMAAAMVDTSQLITFDVADADMHSVDIVYEFDGGGGFQPASRVGGGSSMDSGVPPAVGLTFDWDISADIMGAAPGTVFRITVDDLRPMGVSTCSVAVDVLPPNIPPTCNIVFPGAGATLMTSQNLLFSAADGNGDPLDITYEFDAGTGFQLASRVGGGPSMDLGVPPSGALAFNWDIAADFAISTPGVSFRITVADPRGGMGTCSRVYNIDVIVVPNNPPTCNITSPAASALVTVTQAITFDAADMDGDLLDLFYEFDDGAGFAPASRAGGGPSMDTGVAPATGLAFTWDVNADIAVLTPGVIFRVTADDNRGGIGTCTVSVTAVPGGVCPPAASCGDCNADTVVTILDSLAAAQIAVGLIAPDVLQFNRCNVVGLLSPDPGAVVDIIDSLTLAQFAAGIPVMLVCC